MAAGFKSATVNAASVPSTQTNFPSYVDLSRLGITTLAEAQSVRVYADSAKTTEWAREIVSLSEMHVKVPSLTSTVVMYVDWDGVRADYAVTDTYGRNAVWTGYASVYHLAESSGDATDSTGNAKTLTNANTVGYGSSKIGNGADFGASNTNKRLHNSTSLVAGNSDLTVSMWVNLTTALSAGTPTAQYVLCDFRTTSGLDAYLIGLLAWNSGTPQIRILSSSTTSYTETLTTSTWYKLTFKRVIGGNLTIYRNGTNVASTAYTRAAGGTNNFAFGSTVDPVSFFSGKTDEMRVTATALSDNWETTEYNNQNDEATFWGTWTTVGGSAFVPRTTWFV